METVTRTHRLADDDTSALWRDDFSGIQYLPGDSQFRYLTDSVGSSDVNAVDEA